MPDENTREQELLEEFKAGLDPQGAAAMALRLDAVIAERDAQEEVLLAGMEGLGYARDGGPLDASTAEKAIFALTGVSADRDDLKGRVATLEGDRNDAVARAEAAEAAALKIGGEMKAVKASVTRGENASKPRKLGPMKEGTGLTGSELDIALADAEDDDDRVEIVMSDGTREILGIPPLLVTRDAWRDHTLGKMLRDPVTVHGPAIGGSAFAIDGYALLIDGKQVAYCKRPDPVRVGVGQQASIADDIYF